MTGRNAKPKKYQLKAQEAVVRVMKASVLKCGRESLCGNVLVSAKCMNEGERAHEFVHSRGAMKVESRTACGALAFRVYKAESRICSDPGSVHACHREQVVRTELRPPWG